MRNEKMHGPEIPINPELAKQYMTYLRDEPSAVGYRRRELTEDEKSEAKMLINEIVSWVPGINRDSLTKMVFHSPLDRIFFPGSLDISFGNFDFGEVAHNMDLPESGFGDHMQKFRTVAENYYGIGSVERRFLEVGSRQFSYPALFFKGSAA